MEQSSYNIVEAVADLIDGQLAVLEALHEAKLFRIEARSRLICRCASCRSESEANLAWLRSIRSEDEELGDVEEAA